MWEVGEINREQKRKLASGLKTKGYTEEQISQIMFLQQRSDYQTKICAGDKVRLDKTAIMADPNWRRKELPYRVWCLENFDNKFTAELYKESRPDLWQLEEDGTDPKWLFHASELMLIKENPVS